MTATVIAGAASRNEMQWRAIDWRAAHRNVRRLQARIVKATQAGRWGKVKALQHLLTHSFSSKALAVKRVTENRGKRTAGVDGQVWATAASKMAAIQALKQHGYQPLPLRRVYILKSDGKRRRPLSIPVMADRAMQALYLLAIDPVAETRGDPNSYGFRKGRSPADAIERCFSILCRQHSAQYILEGDIRACFDELDHRWLEQHICMEKPILHKWLKAGFVENGTFQPTEAGAPQGGICSPVMANRALDGLEQRLQETFRTRWDEPSPQINLCRFADDFIITGQSREILEQQVKPVVERFLAERGLTLSAEKTTITHIDKGFDFLGHHLRKYHGKLIIKPSQKSVKALLQKIRGTIKANPTTPAGELISYLNPIISGWANFYRHVVSQKTFAAIDRAIFESLWQWAVRVHPNKGKRWIKRKYFGTLGNDHWVFQGDVVGKDGVRHPKHLRKMDRVPIRRHAKIKSQANPYDPHWEAYFEQRQDRAMQATLKGKRTLLYLWKRQHGRCPICDQKITVETGWHSHHIQWKVHGGSDSADNRVLLHPNCHQQLHALHS